MNEARTEEQTNRICSNRIALQCCRRRNLRGSLFVIGGYNAHRESELQRKCTDHRLYATGAEDWAGKYTGFRVVRKPKN